jgi:hypothetical protein
MTDREFVSSVSLTSGMVGLYLSSNELQIPRRFAAKSSPRSAQRRFVTPRTDRAFVLEGVARARVGRPYPYREYPLLAATFPCLLFSFTSMGASRPASTPRAVYVSR